MLQSRKKILLQFIQRNIPLTVFSIVSGGLASILTISIPIAIAASYELLFGIQSSRAFLFGFLPFEVTSDISNYLLFLGALIILKMIFEFGQRYYSGLLGERLVYDMRNRIFEHQLKVDMEHYEEKGIGKYLLRYSGDLNGLQSYLTTGIIRFSIDVFILIVATMMLFVLQPVVGGILMVGFLGFSGLLWVLNRQLYVISVDRRNKKSGLLSFVNTRLLALLSLRSFNKEVPEIKRYRKRSARLYSVGKRYQRISALINTLVPAAAYLMILFVVLVAYRQKGISDAFDGGALFASVLLIITLLPVLRRIFRVSMVWKKGSISYEKLAKLLNLKANEYLMEKDFRYAAGTINIENLSYFNEGKPVFENLNLKIKGKGIYHMKGGSGSGKTTLIKLISGIYYSQKGIVKIDGQKTNTVNPKSLRRSISIISDDWKLYGKTVFESIAYGRSEIYRTRVNAVLNSLQKDIPSDKRLDLDNNIGDFGNNLSESQRKLLLYARALLTKKPIILIEHPFEGLDDRLTTTLTKMLNSMKERYTILIFSNKLPLHGLQIEEYYDLEEIITSQVTETLTL